MEPTKSVVPLPVPCVKAEDIPPAPKTAARKGSMAQKSAAIYADADALELHAKKLRALLEGCVAP